MNRFFYDKLNELDVMESTLSYQMKDDQTSDLSYVRDQELQI